MRHSILKYFWCCGSRARTRSPTPTNWCGPHGLGPRSKRPKAPTPRWNLIGTFFKYVSDFAQIQGPYFPDPAFQTPDSETYPMALVSKLCANFDNLCVQNSHVDPKRTTKKESVETVSDLCRKANNY